MKAWYTTTFEDGTTVEGEHENPDQAKIAAVNARIREVDPGRSKSLADVKTDRRVKVISVAETTAQDKQRKRGTGDRDRDRGPGDRGTTDQDRDRDRDRGTGDRGTTDQDRDRDRDRPAGDRGGDRDQGRATGAGDSTY